MDWKCHLMSSSYLILKRKIQDLFEVFRAKKRGRSKTTLEVLRAKGEKGKHRKVWQVAGDSVLGTGLTKSNVRK